MEVGRRIRTIRNQFEKLNGNARFRIYLRYNNAHGSSHCENFSVFLRRHSDGGAYYIAFQSGGTREGSSINLD
jgi:hypothetical protein